MKQTDVVSRLTKHFFSTIHQTLRIPTAGMPALVRMCTAPYIISRGKVDTKVADVFTRPRFNKLNG